MNSLKASSSGDIIIKNGLKTSGKVTGKASSSGDVTGSAISCDDFAATANLSLIHILKVHPVLTAHVRCGNC